MSSPTHTPFESDNAKSLEGDPLTGSFIPTDSFIRLLEPKNHIVRGARGSGKTALVKMLAHGNYLKWRNQQPNPDLFRSDFIGVYLAASHVWVGALRAKPWLENSAEEERYFQWQLNLSVAVALISSLKSCVKSLGTTDGSDSLLRELTITRELVKTWFGANDLEMRESVVDFNSLQNVLRRAQYQAERSITESRLSEQVPQPEPPSVRAFGTSAFSPVHAVLPAITEILKLDAASRWVFCIDEAEFLTEQEQRILNTIIRANPGTSSVNFKITTTPYGHYTQDTNVGSSLSAGHDFEYLYIDKELCDLSKAPVFARTLFLKRVLGSQKHSDDVPDNRLFDKVFGPSPLIDPKDHSIWTEDSEEFRDLRRYGSDRTVSRAVRLLTQDGRKFSDEISRKIHAALLLRSTFERLRGREKLGLFCGANLIVRCSDGNPRRLLQLFNRFFLRHEREILAKKQIRGEAQETILFEFAQETLSRARAEPRVGPNLHEILTDFQKYVRARLYHEPITTDQVSSIEADSEVTGEDIDAIHEGVNLGFFFPHPDPKTPDNLPQREGVFQVAFIFAPLFGIPPRREKYRALSVIRKRAKLRTSFTVSDGQAKLL